jgi:quercetin dioxygenase-like cupin family protein
MRAVLAAAKLASVTDMPLYFRVSQIAIAPEARTGTANSAAVLYQISGSTQVSISGQSRTIRVGQGLFVPRNAKPQLQAAGRSSILLRFSLESAADLSRASETAPAAVSVLYTTTEPIPDLKSGPYDITLTRAIFPAGMPTNRPHHRTGAALYYILSGVGANTVDGKTQSKGPGSFIYEPARLIHQWGNPGTEPLVILQFNINPQGVPAVVPASTPVQ